MRIFFGRFVGELVITRREAQDPAQRGVPRWFPAVVFGCSVFVLVYAESTKKTKTPGKTKPGRRNKKCQKARAALRGALRG